MYKRKRRFTPKAALVFLLVAALSLSACGKTPNQATSEQSSVEESFSSESSAEESKTEAESEPAGSESAESAPAEETKDSAADYLKELQETEMYEFSLASYNSDYKVGDTVIITVEMECEADFGGTIGSCVGKNYEWQQKDFEATAGSYTLSWEIKPSVDTAQLSIWYSGGNSVGIKSIDVAIAEPEIGLTGDYIKLFTGEDNLEFALSKYNSKYQVGDYVKISVEFESDGDFSGALGTCQGSNYEWVQQDFVYEQAGTYTLTWTAKPSVDMAQIGIWWIGGTAVGVKSINVDKVEQEVGLTGEYKALFTEPGNYEFYPSIVEPQFKFGDEALITVTFESDGEFNGCMGTCVGSNYDWKQVEYSSETGLSTWQLQISPVVDMVQVGIWWIGGTAVGIVDIDVDITYWGYQHHVTTGALYTATQKGDVYTFNPSDYCDYEEGDVITITAAFNSNDVYNGCLKMKDANGAVKQAGFESNGGVTTCSLVLAGSKEDAEIDFWWMNTRVGLDSITVVKGGELEQPTEPTEPTDPSKVDTSSWQIAFKGFSSKWGGWQAKNGNSGVLDFSAAVADIMSINNIASADELGGVLFQIWNVSEEYAGVEVEYTLYIDEVEFKKEKIAFSYNTDGKFNDYLLQLTNTAVFDWGNYEFTGNETLRAVVSLADAGEGEDPGAGEDTTIKTDSYTFDVSKNGENETFAFDLYHYFSDLTIGDQVKITAEFSCDGGWYGGAVGVTSSDAADGDWDSVSFSNDDGVTTYSTTATVKYDQSNGGQVQIWWIGGADVTVKLTFEKLDGEGTEE